MSDTQNPTASSRLDWDPTDFPLIRALLTEVRYASGRSARPPHRSLEFLKRRMLAELSRGPVQLKDLCGAKHVRMRARAYVELLREGKVASGPDGVSLVVRDPGP